jgi:hypothetical protein
VETEAATGFGAVLLVVVVAGLAVVVVVHGFLIVVDVVVGVGLGGHALAIAG